MPSSPHTCPCIFFIPAQNTLDIFFATVLSIGSFQFIINAKWKKLSPFTQEMNYDIPRGFLSLWNQFGVFVLNVKVFGLLFLWGMFFTVKHRYKTSRDHPCMEMNTIWYHHYLNLFICRTESPYFYTLIWGPLFQNCPSKESQNTV